MADNPTLARYANQMPEATGVAWNMLSDAPLYTATELLFYGPGVDVAVTLPGVTLSVNAVESIASSVGVTLPLLQIASQTAEVYPPDVFMFLPNISVSASTSEALGPADVAVSYSIQLSSAATLSLAPTVGVTLPNISISADVTHTEQAEIFADVALSIPSISVTADATHAALVYADGAVSLTFSVSATSNAVELPTYVSSIVRALVGTKVSHLRIRTKVES